MTRCDDVEGGRFRIGREDVTLEPEPRRGQRQHAAELAAAEDADRRAGIEHRRRITLTRRNPWAASATPAVCAARHASRRCASAASRNARTLAASSAALMAPASPMASVPTGTPAGICTIERASPAPTAPSIRSARRTPAAGHGRGHARQMRRAARAGDDHLEARRPRALGESDRAVRACDAPTRCASRSRRRARRASRRRASWSASRTGCP